MSTEQIILTLASVSTALAVLLSAKLIWDHLRNWSPSTAKEQTMIIYIILMVPLFAIDSLVGLIEFDASEWVEMLLDAIKECYEAWVIRSFLILMYSYLEISSSSIPKSLEGRHIHHTWPFTYFMKDMHLDKHSINTLKLWTDQFIILRPILSIISLIAQITGHYDRIYMIVSIILNISVTMAVYSLILFYHAFAKELSPHRPLAQFLNIKGVVFFSFWQGVIVQVLVAFKVIHENHWYNVEEIEVGIQNFLVCIEMGLLFSFGHLYAFHANDYKNKNKAKSSPKASDSSPNKSKSPKSKTKKAD